MFRCENLTVTVGEGRHVILRAATARFQTGRMNAVIGPSGCGKTTLMKSMLGILSAEGEIWFGGTRVTSPEDLVGRVGFVPQFSIAHPQLTVAESVSFALQLFVVDKNEQKRRLESVLKTIGLSEHREKRVKSLSGGQLRRLGLGLELANEPEYLVCDEVTSGLDPNSEDSLLLLMNGLAADQGKTFICIIHNLARLDRFDWITVVHQGAVVFQGSLSQLHEFFGISDALHLYDVLNTKPLEEWLKRREEWGRRHPATNHLNVTETKALGARPGPIAQFAVMMWRRFLLFFRDTGYLGLTAAITFGFPCLVVIFALNGLPQIEGISPSIQQNTIEWFKEQGRYKLDLAQTGSLVSGLIMFQVILLTLMGSNNGAREIAAERPLYEKERLNGLSPLAYSLGKICFTSLIALIQGAWMCFFVKTICHFPGDGLLQAGILGACCLAMSLLSLGFSACLASAEKASLLSIYLVGFQLPLSGVVLALPAFIEPLCRPLINAYWSWSGYLSIMKDAPPPNDRFFDAVITNYTGTVPAISTCLAALAFHCVVGLWMVFYGCNKRQWA